MSFRSSKRVRLADVRSEDADIAGDAAIDGAAELVAVVAEPARLGDAPDVAAVLQHVDRIARAKADRAADRSEARGRLTRPRLDIDRFEQFGLDRHAADMVEQGATLRRAVDRDVKQRILEPADIDFLREPEPAADRDRRDIAEQVGEVVRLDDLDFLAVDRDIGQGTDDDDVGHGFRLALFGSGGMAGQRKHRGTARQDKGTEFHHGPRKLAFGGALIAIANQCQQHDRLEKGPRRVRQRPDRKECHR